MANGYLGKISAIVSANTADFDGKLSKSAKEVSSFARSVQSNLTSASRQAARSLEGIYTPLQKFERSLQAAASMKLSFKGFPGMIKDLDSLQSRLNSALSKRQVDIVLKTTGMKSVTDVRDALYGLKSKDIEIITRFGGMDKLKELRDQISSSQPVIDVRVEIENAKSQIATVNEQINAAKKAGGTVTVGVDTAEIDRLTGKLATATAALADLRKQASKTSGSSSGLEQIITDIDELNSKRAKLEAKAIRVRGDERELQSVNRQIDAISKKIESLETKKAKLSVSTEDFTSKIDSAQKLVDKLTAKLEKAKASGTTTDVKELEQQLAAAEKQASKLERKLAKTIKVNVGVDADLGELDAVIRNAENAGTVLGKLPALMDALGRSDFSAASDKMRQLQSVTSEITAPLESSVKKLAGLGAEVAGAFQPALQSAQKGVEMINAAIERQGSASGTLQDKTLESYYDSVRSKVERTIASIERLNQVSSQLGQLKTGREFVFEQPRLNEAINRGGDIGNRAAALPAEALRTNPAIAQSLVDIRRLSDEAGVAYAKFLTIKSQKQPTGEAQKELDAVVKKLLEAQAVAEKEIKVVLDTAEADAKATALKAKITAMKQDVAFTVTGKVQNFDQARSEMARLQAEMGKLDATQRAPIARKIVALGKLIDTGEIKSLDDVRVLIERIEKAVGRKLRINIDKAEAKGSLDAINKDLRSIADALGPPAGMDRLKESTQAADAAVEKLSAGLDKARLKADIGQLRVDLGAAESLPAGAAKDQAIADISTRAESITQDAGVVAGNADSVEKARARITSLNDAWAQSVRGLPETEAKADAFFTGILADIGKLDLADRISLDPIIGEIINLIQTGAGISTVTARMLELEAATNELASAGKVSAAIEKLSPTAARNDLEARLAAAKAAASPGETVGDVGRETELRGSLGKDLADSSRGLDLLKGGITSLKGQIDALPEGVRSRFIPAIRDAENEFVRLSTSTSVLPGQIDAARQRVQQLSADAARATQAMNFSQSFGGAGTAGLNLGLDQRALQGYNAQLQILQGYMSRIPADAAGPAVAAFSQLRNAIAQAFDGGTINTAETRREIAALLQATTQTTAALAGVSAGRIGRDIQRAGDIGRRGFDNMSLALNQAAFAIDDFMSSTGGLEFKLRAVSNNITQLAFILGGTTGLFIGLGAVIAGQAAVGIIKWINNGRTAEDQTKALNEALARQKSLVEELAEAFRSLGASATRGIFSEQAQQARDFAREIENILKKQRELGLQRVVGNDPAIQRERAEQTKLRREIEKEENPAVRVGKQQQLRASEEREQRRAQLLGVQPPPSAAEIRREVRLRAPVPFRDAAEGIPEGTDVASRVAQADAIRPAVDRLKEIVSEGDSSFDFGRFEIASRQLEVLGDLLDRLDRAIGDAVAQAATDVAKASRGPAEQIRQAQEEVAKAIELGLPGARLFGEELNKSAEQLEKAYKNLEDAAAGKDENGRDIGPAEQKALVDAASSEINTLQAQRASITAQSDALRYERTVDPQRQIDARMGRAASNLGTAGLEDGRIARRMREIENERETIRQRSALPEFQTPEMVRGLQDAEQALNEEAAAIEAATIAIKIFADALNRASEEAKGNLNSAQQRADEARRADLGNSTPQTQEARKQAEADLERQKETERAAQTEIAVERDRLEKQAASPEASRMQQIDEQLKSGREFDPGLVKQRGAVEADAAAAEESRKKFQDVVDAQKEFSDALDAQFQAEDDLGIAGTFEERRQQLKDAGRGDLVNNADATHRKMSQAENAVGLGGLNYSDAVDVAKVELAAAIERQAQAANALAEIDEKIAAAGMSGDREDLIREREALQAKMEDDAKASQAKVDAARDASTREAEQAKSGERGRELTRTPEERFKAESEQGLADIQTYFERRAEANNGIRPQGDIEAQAAAEDRFRKDREKEARTATAAGRGAELGMTPEEKFRRDFKEGAGADINARAKEMRDKGEDPTKFLRQSLANQMESVAPMLKGFQDERQTAMLQGPSRAALNVSDVSTSQGASELTRLIRGDDSAKDVNLAELQKQSGYLEEIRNDLKANNPGVLL
jgi:predicted  nucleic acid-binding Zn-ribbon protein